MMTDSEVKFIVSRVIDNANEAKKEEAENADFHEGRMFAYYEILDTIKNELLTREQDLKEFGLDIDLEKTFL